MPIPKPGQKTIPLKDWRRFLRVADWFERTIEQGNGTRQPSYGHSLIVKTPVDGIDARSGTTISSATCIKCVAAETSTPGERTLHETDEELVVYNAEEQDVPGEIFVKTTLSPNGTRYVDRGRGDRRFELKDNLPASGSVIAGQQATAHPVNAAGVVDTAVDQEFEVYDELGVYRGRKKDKYSSPHNQGSRGIARWSKDAQKWFIVSMQPHALQIMGVINEAGDVAAADSTFDVDAVYVMQPPGAIITDTDPASSTFGITNREFDGDNNDEAIATWDEKDTDWKALDVMCPT